jgi:hypothetical protein
MKVIFLDIDGVLNTTRTRNPRQLPYVVEKRLVNRLRRLVAQTNAKVMLSSTWRYDPAGLYSAKRYGIPFQDVIPDWPHRHRRDEVLGCVGIPAPGALLCSMTKTTNSTGCRYFNRPLRQASPARLRGPWPIS